MKNLARLPESEWPAAAVKPLCVWLSPCYQVSLWLEREERYCREIVTRLGQEVLPLA